MKKISILGSTGSIGTQALQIIEDNRDRFSVTALACGRNVALLKQQIRRFAPAMVSVEREEDALTLQREFPGLAVSFGEEGLVEAALFGKCDLLLNALVGMRGLVPTYRGIEAGRDIALANKETLVAGGPLIMEAAERAGVSILPVDSEHSAIFQCLKGNRGQRVRRILLTASGGPFRGYDLEQLRGVTVEQALRHPNWSMGNKITIDSATMMNKGLEVIEARWLFGVPPESIQVVVHPESIIHSMVEFEDRAILAQLGLPDMRGPIAYAFTYPDRLENRLPAVDVFQRGSLHFEEADTKAFRCLALAYQALAAGGAYPAVLNAANEVLVQKFLEKRIKFIDIQNTIEKVLEGFEGTSCPDLEGILEIDREIRGRIEKWD